MNHLSGTRFKKTTFSSGAGLVRSRDMVTEALGRGELVELLSEWNTLPMPIHVVHPSGMQKLPKLRVFIEASRRSSVPSARFGR